MTFDVQLGAFHHHTETGIDLHFNPQQWQPSIKSPTAVAAFNGAYVKVVKEPKPPRYQMRTFGLNVHCEVAPQQRATADNRQQGV